MSRVFKSVLLRAFVGFALGALIGATILWLVRRGTVAEPMSAGTLFVNFLLSGLYGALVVGATTFYAVERWSIARATLCHLFVTLAGLYALGLAQGWLAFTAPGFLILTASSVAFYFLIWLAQYLSYRRRIGQMNRCVRVLKDAQNRSRLLDDRRQSVGIRQNRPNHPLTEEEYP